MQLKQHLLPRNTRAWTRLSELLDPADTGAE